MFKRFYKDIKNTFYNPDFYSRISKTGLSTPFWLFVKLSAISAFVVLLVLTPLAINFVKDARESAQNEYFPSELEIVIKDGVATANLTEEPYYIFNSVFDDEILPEDTIKIAMINTGGNLTLQEIQDEEAFFLLTKSSFIFKDGEELRIFKYDQVFTEEVVINQEEVGFIVNSFVKKLPIIIFFLGILIFTFITIVGPIVMLSLAFALSLITIVVNKVRKLGLQYKDVFKMSMYALIPAIVVSIFIYIVFRLDSFSFLLTATIFAVVLVWNTRPKKLIADTTGKKDD